MTQEEKAKAYDKALEKARTIVNSINVGLIGKDSFEAVFPELKESEDERIRKKLISYFSAVKGFSTLEYNYGITNEEAVDWLKKQGDKDKLIKELGEYKVKYTQETLGQYLEKQGEHKSADKVEPKFHEGEWVTDGICKCQIRFIDDTQYWYSKNCILGNIESIDKRYHLWTIEDAKPGDALVDEDNNIGIHKEIEGLYWNSYIYLGCDGKLRGFSIGGSHKQANTRPATQEQCVALMKAMTDAGWEFDFDKKELNKIDTYCQDNCKGFQETGRCFCDGECKAKKEHVKQNLQDNNLRRIEQKSAWSEEDKNAIQVLKDIVKRSNEIDEKIYTMPLKEKLYAWLKSLKDKVQPKL